jgi:hypothetical protein
MSRRNDPYVRLLAFYTPRWRARNGRAVLDTLRDEHARSGRESPSMTDAISFARAGVYERLLAPRRSAETRITTVLVVLAALASASYSVLVLWAPGADWPGHVGPFSNPAPIAGALLILSAAFALADRDGAARLLSAAGGAAVLLMTGFSIEGGWVGPSFQISFGLVGLSLLATRWIRRPVPVSVAVVLVCGPAAVPFFHGLVLHLVQSTDWFGAVWVGCTAAGAALLLGLGWCSPVRALEEGALNVHPQTG